MDTELLPSRIRDAIRLCNNTASPKFVGFLRSEETLIAENAAENIVCKYAFYGGYEGAERVFFGVFPDWCESPPDYFPIKALTFTFRQEDILGHRNFLGTFMSLGIARETVGDILIEKGRAVAFFTEDVVNFVREQTTKISNVGVTVTEGFSLPLPEMSGFVSVTDTVASLRLDCVVASLGGCSRKTATELIENKLVSVNSRCVERTVKTVQNGDSITIRGKGKFIIESVNDRSRKDRFILKAKKYI